MQVTFFSFIMSLLWFNLYIIIINTFRKKDNFIISFNTFPLVFFLFLSIFRLIFNFEIPGSIIIRSRNVFPKLYNFIKESLYFKSFSIDVFQFLVLIWLIGTLIILINNIKKYITFKEGLKRLNVIKNKNNKQIFDKILKHNKINNEIEIVQSNDINLPFIMGVTKGKIYIPNINFSKEEFEYIISHEINHFLERDSLKKILIQSVKYVFWWNPFVHLFANNFNHILEIQCDLKTTANFSEKEKIRYLESITKIINNTTNNNIKYESIPHLVNIKAIDSLKQRFRIVLNYKEKRSLFNIFNIGLSILILCLYISSYFIIIQPYYSPNNDEVHEEQDISDSFIIETLNNNYDIYIDNVFKYSIKSLEELNESLSKLPIYKEGVD